MRDQLKKQYSRSSALIDIGTILIHIHSIRILDIPFFQHLIFAILYHFSISYVPYDNANLFYPLNIVSFVVNRFALYL